MKPILEIKGISKKYQIEGNKKPYLSLRENLFSFLEPGSKKEEFWALQDISFDVMPGDTLGIIGKNGAGKSTLLKILSKITPPTKGNIIGRGRIASLLEVGTGFHPELSGRENIYMNGSILGMRRAEITKNFDAIVDFSGVEKFLDTPLKHYSSGMQLRLAFAVAAFLENEILIIDEVLAVGDAEFQKKCLGKMGEVSKSGRTILFVSHDLNSLNTICRSAILLEHGKLIASGLSAEVISRYVHANKQLNRWIQSKSDVSHAHFNEIRIEMKGTQPDLKLHVDFSLAGLTNMKKSFVAFNLSNQMGQMIGQSIPNSTPFIDGSSSKDKVYTCEIELKGFVPDEYFLSAWIGPHYSDTYDWQKEILSFSIVESPQENRLYPHARECGAIVPQSKMLN